jgi:hypothetical protein
MTKLKPGDRVNCKIKADSIVSPYAGDYDETRTFEIIGKDQYGYYLYVPIYMYLKDAAPIDQDACDFLQINEKYIGEQIVYIAESMICKITSKIDGCSCSRCKEFFHMAEPNQPDGSMICWQCRKYRFR